MKCLKVKGRHREFICNGTRIPDPAPKFTVEHVRELLTPSCPEIATASLARPEDIGDALSFTFSRAIGRRGYS
jgi:PRTRC genetic system protein C